MANHVGATAKVSEVNVRSQAAPAKPPASVAKPTAHDTVNISAAGKAASQAKQTKASTEVKHGGERK
ncbi:MAG: hypothetical protein WA211_19940 [Candidatus Acidiferrales bacterium]